MRWFVTGARGQLGTALVRYLLARDDEVRGVGSELDVADAGAVAAALDSGATPDVLVNAAAFTKVDRCETEPERAHRVNALAPGLLARLAGERGISLVHVSTDYVFDGRAGRPYRESDPPNPQGSYGRTKLAGERAVFEALPEALIVRTSWVFGHGRNFVAAILEHARSGKALRVVADQHGRPTSAWDLAQGIVSLVERRVTGLYHLANQGQATWWEVARVALDHVGLREVEVEPVATAALGLPAPRPLRSVLDLDKAARAGVRLRLWPEALAEHLDAGFDVNSGERS